LLKGKWDDIQFTCDEVEQCDYIVVINHPTRDINVRCRKGGRILIIQEPPYERNNYLTSYFPYFDIIITAFDRKYSSGIIHQQAALPWLIDRSYDDLVALQLNVSAKKDKLSWVTSNSNVNPGHEPRLRFLEKIKHSSLDVELFGRGIRHIDDKFEGLYPYKYTLAIENYSDANYWTEKIADAYLSWTMPIYYGCTNIEDFFPENSFIKINIHEPEASIETIEKCMRDRLFEKNQKALGEARELVLNKYQFFPFVSKIAKDHAADGEVYLNCMIPKNPEVPGLMTRIKSFLQIK
jgi:hypothetical protein